MFREFAVFIAFRYSLCRSHSRTSPVKTASHCICANNTPCEHFV